ncbi:PAS domain S-box protein [Paenibacillus sp.]|uniref:PAS domain-containing protein n=1 Tax=Paenibacillus sp. TaxID=58172 RepID=UPI002812874E|nr:PAS domain S-box protein [Paenibacillus sp.]
MTLPQMETDSLFQHAFFHAKIGMAVVALNGRFQKVNPSICKLTGYSEAELLTMTYLDITHPDDAGVGERMRAKLIEGTMDDYQNEKRYIRKDGVHVWVQHTLSVVRDADGVPQVFVTQLQDISARKKAEHLLQRHMQQYKSLFDEHPDLVYAVSMDGELTSLNHSVERITGYTADAWRSAFPKPLEEGVRHALEHAHEGSLDTFRFETEVPHADGSKVHLSVTHAPIIVDGEAVGVYGIAKDITQQARLIRQLKESERKYRLLAENSLDVIVRYNPFGILTYVSPSSASVLGFLPEELVGVDAMSLVHPEDVVSLRETFADERLSTFRCRTKYGDYVWIESRTKSIRGKQTGKATEYIAVLRDVSEREAERRRLRDAEEQYRELVEHSPDAIFVGVGGRFAYVNDTAVALLGAKNKEQLYELDPLTLIHPAYRDASVARRRMVERDKRVAELAQSVFVRLDGKAIDVEVKSIPTIYNDREAVHTIVRDVTERKKTEALLQQSEKLSAAGQLAAGIAHEIRNPLTSLKGFLHLMQTGAAQKPHYFRIMNDELSRVETILGELLILAKPHSFVMATRDTTALLRSVGSLLETQANLRGIELSLDLPAEPLHVYGDDNQLKQVFINLVKNGIEAMPDGGLFVIRARAEGDRAIIRFVDEGSGIPEEKLPFIGRPFFTTKEYGTGLGLSVSYKIIEAHRGTVSVTSIVNEGTSFTIALPLATL